MKGRWAVQNFTCRRNLYKIYAWEKKRNDVFLENLHPLEENIKNDLKEIGWLLWNWIKWIGMWASDGMLLTLYWVCSLRSGMVVFVLRVVENSVWTRILESIFITEAGPSGRAVSGVGLRPLACWDYRFESQRGHGCLSVVSVVRCQVEVSATS